VNEDKATRYNRRKRLARLGSVGCSAALLVALLLTDGSTALRSWAATAVHAAPAFAQPGLMVVVYSVALILLSGSVDLPLGFYSDFVLERRYGMSNQLQRAWLFEQGKSLLLQLALGSIAAATVYSFIRWFPRGWWLPAGATFAFFACALANLAPVFLLPLFYSVRPLDRQSLRARLLRLAERAGADVLGAYEWGMGDKTKAANAALTGLGRTRRILVSDTMLADYSDEEIEIVLAHELGHHVHGDIWRTLALQSALVMAGLYVASRALEALGPLVGLLSPDDVAGLPLLILAGGAVSVLGLPLVQAASRAYERRADRFALAITENPTAFVSAMRRLAAQNLAEEHPTKLVQWLFYSHPPIRERIAAAEALLASGKSSSESVQYVSTS
jgi:STE24 endopeptidase